MFDWVLNIPQGGATYEISLMSKLHFYNELPKCCFEVSTNIGSVNFRTWIVENRGSVSNSFS